MLRRSVLLLLILLNYSSSFSQDTIKIATYNLLRYSGSTDRNIHFKKIINQISADIYIAQELSNSSGVTNFLSNVLNFENNFYEAANFYDDNDIDQALFFRGDKFELLSTSKIIGDPRNIMVYRLKHKNTEKIFFIFNLHLKASSGSTNQARRATQVDQLIEYTKQMSDDHFYVAAGDFNIYSTDEPAYRKFFEQTSTGYGKFNDVIVSDGKYNNEQYAEFHTQSPRTTQFGGGAPGGLDDRFDYILFSDSLFLSNKTFLIKDSYTVFGNDGNHYNKAINDMPNNAVSQDIADALHDASDHLPVFANIVFSNEIVEEENNSPTASDTVFTLNENPDDNIIVGSILASDVDGDSLIYEIISGNDQNIFSISSNGEISVNNGSLIDYDNYQSFILIVNVSDGELSNNSQVTINIVEDIPLSLETITNNFIEIYPNPFDKILYLKSKGNIINKIEVLNSEGKVYYYNKSIKNDIIDFSNAKPGIYIIGLKIKNFTFKYKVIKKGL